MANMGADPGSNSTSNEVEETRRMKRGKVVKNFGMSKLARYTSCPNQAHCEVLVRVFRYLKGTISLGLHYQRFLGVLEGYRDANLITKKSGSNGVTGYVFTLVGGTVSWKYSRQTLITRYTFESELCALDTSRMEAEWLHGLMQCYL
ncbi:secreted RxLR effector protein 161-like [Apium graveolens]|uniref:secreted RxLR effector protein 161-like n=1 Tax=Apium graveolens TaxID=4045 RepID=UPI003D7A7E6A